VIHWKRDVDPDHLHFKLARVLSQAIILLRDHNMPFKFFEGKRSAERQGELFSLGHSKCDGIVVVSEHQVGRAMDLVYWKNGNWDWSDEYMYKAMGYLIMHEFGEIIDWGYLLWGWDLPHFQLKPYHDPS